MIVCDLSFIQPDTIIFDLYCRDGISTVVVPVLPTTKTKTTEPK